MNPALSTYPATIPTENEPPKKNPEKLTCQLSQILKLFLKEGFD